MEIYKNKSRLSSLSAGQRLKMNGLVTTGKIPYKDVHTNTYENVTVTSIGIVKDKTLVKSTSVFELYPNETNENVQNELLKSIIKKQTKKLNKALVLVHNFDSNYQHFLIETLPRMYLLNIMYTVDIPVIISKAPFVKEILSLLFPNIKFLVVNDEEPYLIENLAVYMKLFTRNLSDFHPVMLSSLAFFKEKALAMVNSEKRNDQLLYVGRRLDPQNSGSGRVMTNQNDLIRLLHSFDVTDSYFETMTISEKVHELCQTKIVITPIGANIMNLIFAKNVEKVIIISHKSAFGGPNWFVTLLEKMCPQLHEVILFNDIQIESVESKNGNVPYTVDLLKFEQLLQNVL